MIARCGGDLRYFGISDILFDTQQDWAASEDPNVVVENLKKIGRTAGMDDVTLDACMADGANAEALVAHFEKNMEADAVEGTPTIFVNGVKHPNMTYPELKAIIETELAKEHGNPPERHQGDRTCAHSGRALGRSDPGRPRGRRHQGRSPRR
jgi:protein-disulfide isomerase